MIPAQRGHDLISDVCLHIELVCFLSLYLHVCSRYETLFSTVPDAAG